MEDGDGWCAHFYILTHFVQFFTLFAHHCGSSSFRLGATETNTDQATWSEDGGWRVEGGGGAPATAVG